jgi:hypothetical protein
MHRPCFCVETCEQVKLWIIVSFCERERWRRDAERVLFWDIVT